MKRKKMTGFAVFLSAAMALSACAASVAPSGASAALSVPADAAMTMDAAAPSESAESLETFSFSMRDMDGEWDVSTAIPITLNGTAISCESDAVTVSGSVATIAAAGTYVLSGSLDNGYIIVDAAKEDKVQLVLNGASVRSDDFAAIYVKQADKVFITLADGTENVLSNGGTFENIDENDVDGVIFSKDDLTLNGFGKLTVTSPAKHGVVSKDDLAVTGGTYEITAASHALSGKDSVGIAGGAFALNAGKDGIHSENNEDAQKGNVYFAGGTFAIKAGDDGVSASGMLQIDAGTFSIDASEGLEGNYIRINDGAISVRASDDGINAARKSGAYTPTVEINGGAVSVAVGPGDTDGIDSNGDIIITGGDISVTGNSAFDIDGKVTFTGGSVTVNGQQVSEITNQFGGGRGGMGRNFGGGRMPGQVPDGDAQAPNGDAQTPNNGEQTPNGDMRGWKRGGKRSGAAAGQSEPPDVKTSATPTGKMI